MSVRRRRSGFPRSGTRRLAGDRGTTFVELLVSIVLIGTAVVGTLAALRATILASAINRDHANAHAWLQTASDVLYADFRECDSPPPGGIDLFYENLAKSTNNPEGWPGSQIDLVEPVLYWNIEIGTDNTIDEFWSDTQCDEDSDLQRVTLRVFSPDGDIVEDVEVILDDQGSP